VGFEERYFVIFDAAVIGQGRQEVRESHLLRIADREQRWGVDQDVSGGAASHIIHITGKVNGIGRVIPDAGESLLFRGEPVQAPFCSDPEMA